MRQGVVDLDELATAPDPYRALDELRADGVLLQLSKPSSWLVLGYDAVREALFDESLTAELAAYIDYQDIRSRTGRESPLRWFTKDPLLRGDPDHLTAVRRCLTRVLSPQAVRSYETLVGDVIARVVEDVGRRDVVDLYRDYGLRVATEVMCELFRIPDGDTEAFSSYSQAFVKIMAPRRSPLEAASLNRAIRSFRRYVDDMLERAAAGGGGMVELLLEARRSTDASGDLSDDDIARLLITLMAVGTQSVAAATSQALIGYFTDDDVRVLYPADDDGRWRWTLESLRHQLFILFMVRYAVADVELDGATIRTGDLVWLSPAAAHRDPDVFDAPATFDPSRDLSAAMPFGLGPHYCSGASLARLEIQHAVSRFVDAFPDSRLAPEGITWACDTFSRRPIGASLRIAS